MWGKPNGLDRVAQVLLALAAVIALGNGLFMLIDPFGWYEAVGTVKATGPANGHFIRDIALAYLLCAGMLGHAAINLPMRWGTALLGSVWLSLHGGLHIYEVVRGLCAPGIFWKEAPGTLGPPLIALAGIGLMLARSRVSPVPVPSGLFLKLADQLTHGLSPHLHDIAKAPGFLAEKYQHFTPLSLHRHAATAEQISMARIGAVMAEDCGPCSLIAAHGAVADGVETASVNAALAGNPPTGPGADAYGFAQAIAANTADVNELGDAIEAQYGRAVRTELTFAAALVRVHPALKRGLGFAQSCAAVPLKV